MNNFICNETWHNVKLEQYKLKQIINSNKTQFCLIKENATKKESINTLKIIKEYIINTQFNFKEHEILAYIIIFENLRLTEINLKQQLLSPFLIFVNLVYSLIANDFNSQFNTILSPKLNTHFNQVLSTISIDIHDKKIIENNISDLIKAQELSSGRSETRKYYLGKILETTVFLGKKILFKS